MNDAEIEATILRLLCSRAPAASICPSDVARSLHEDEAAWRAAMPRVRAVAQQLAAGGVLRITQGDAILEPDAPLRGAIRLRRGAAFPAPGRALAR